ncbi:hypothetical protein B296_00002559 [Ensete ventricosum]|uniref:Uncharacterized protein n=1 Tax=Ensete ventricosum TaxID=4639 RepID=A0A427AGA1_ENSVE|nr:hypothetical protein B296_00002559 [Ensete ventricosum]
MRWDLIGSSLGESEIGKLAGNTPGDRRKKTIGLTARMSEATGLCGRKRLRVEPLELELGICIQATRPTYSPEAVIAWNPLLGESFCVVCLALKKIFFAHLLGHFLYYLGRQKYYKVG